MMDRNLVCGKLSRLTVVVHSIQVAAAIFAPIKTKNNAISWHRSHLKAVQSLQWVSYQK
jgi:hypothetical protein